MSIQAIPPSDLTGFQRDCLVAINRLDKPKGLDIKDLLDHVYDADEINHGRLYPNLDKLVQMGLVSKTERDGRTNEYLLTARGERVLEDLAAWIGNE